MEWIIIVVAAGGLFLGYLCGFYASKGYWVKTRRDTYDRAYADALDAYVSLSSISHSTNVRVISPTTYHTINRKIEEALERGVK